MSMIQLNPPLVLLTPKGKAVAHFLIDYSMEDDLYWICFQHETGECWTWNNKHVRIDNNATIGRSGVLYPMPPQTNGISNGESKSEH